MTTEDAELQQLVREFVADAEQRAAKAGAAVSAFGSALAAAVEQAQRNYVERRKSGVSGAATPGANRARARGPNLMRLTRRGWLVLYVLGGSCAFLFGLFWPYVPIRG